MTITLRTIVEDVFATLRHDPVAGSEPLADYLRLVAREEKLACPAPPYPADKYAGRTPLCHVENVPIFAEDAAFLLEHDVDPRALLRERFFYAWARRGVELAAAARSRLGGDGESAVRST